MRRLSKHSSNTQKHTVYKVLAVACQTVFRKHDFSVGQRHRETSHKDGIKWTTKRCVSVKQTYMIQEDRQKAHIHTQN